MTECDRDSETETAAESERKSGAARAAPDGRDEAVERKTGQGQGQSAGRPQTQPQE